MSYINEFPHSRMFDSDLRQILEMYNTVKGLPKTWEEFSADLHNDWEEFSADLHNDWDAVKLFVNNYFTELDVQQEINNKIDGLVADGTIDSMLKEEFDAYTQEINSRTRVLESRMDTFTSLPPEATTGDAEVADARVDYTGKTWENLGGHIRGVTSQLSSEIAELDGNVFEIENKFVSQNFTEWEKYDGLAYVSAEQNIIVFNPHETYSSYIKVFDKETLVYCSNPTNTTNNYICVGENFTDWNSLHTFINCDNPVRYRVNESPLPTKDSPLTIPSGAVVVITTSDISTFDFYEFGEVKEKLNENIKLNETQIQQVLSNDVFFVSIEKTSDTLFVIDLGKYSTTLQNVVNSGTNSNLWNLLGIYYGADNLITGDIIGPIKEAGEADFMGGYHGDEENLICLITCDGKVWDRTTKKQCNEINIHLKSKLFRVSSKEYIFDRYINIRITKNKIEIENLHKCLVDNFQMERAATGGLMGMPNTYLQAVVMNNYTSTTAPTDKVNNHSKDNVSATLYWSNGSITLNNIIGHERETYRGFDNVFTNENPIRNKIYFDTVSDLVPTQFDNGDTLLGKFELLFN